MSIPAQSASQPPQFVLAVGLARSGTKAGTVSGYTLRYHIGSGDTYLLQTPHAFRLARNCGTR